MDTTYGVSVLSKTGKVEQTLISNILKKIGSKNTWEDFLEELLDDVEVTDDENDALDKKKCKRDHIYCLYFFASNEPH